MVLCNRIYNITMNYIIANYSSYPRRIQFHNIYIFLQYYLYKNLQQNHNNLNYLYMDF